MHLNVKRTQVTKTIGKYSKTIRLDDLGSMKETFSLAELEKKCQYDTVGYIGVYRVCM